MSERISDEELASKMREHFKERKALYDGLTDETWTRATPKTCNPVTTSSGLEALQAAESEEPNAHLKPVERSQENTQ